MLNMLSVYLNRGGVCRMNAKGVLRPHLVYRICTASLDVKSSSICFLLRDRAEFALFIIGCF
jgi:hypothetical protein